jgi:K(+)-stimulated pyrophosphate-energized sodium pump
MKLLKRAMRPITDDASPRSLLTLLLSALLLIIPGFAAAAGGENVRLQFSAADQIYLWVSLAFGFVALAYGAFIAKSVLAQSPGSAKMQEIGQAIKDGALAYLRQQIRTMSIFIVILFVGLIFMFQGRFGLNVAILTAVAFVMGVAASYIAGYAGMLMAVNGNMRTAHAALTSYKSALEVAFRSGAVAGMVTVGLGLIGATVILKFAGENATRLLVGFGFGGSLAALFMRVGGGIFTKAADVGADLVGKVEAGIPEDDPRNPATIADNVGDNVGDCAGMAADVFESYEVTLVAAIILGAATAAVFDTATWTKLVLFALMARGVGIIASIVGIQLVRGTDDLNADPLKPIRRGFYNSAVVAAVLTVALAYFMMGGQGNPIRTSSLVSFAELQQSENDMIQRLQRQLVTTANGQIETAKGLVENMAETKRKPVDQVTLEDFREPTGEWNKESQTVSQAAIQRAIRSFQPAPAGSTPPPAPGPIQAFEITAADLIHLGLKDKGFVREDESSVMQALQTRPETLPEPPKLAGYQKVTNPNDPNIKALAYATPSTPAPPGSAGQQKPYQTVGSKYTGAGTDRYIVARLQVKADIPARPGQGQMPGQPAQKIDRTQWVGPIQERLLTDQLAQQKAFAAKEKITAEFNILESAPVALYANPTTGGLALVVEGNVARAHTLRPQEQLSFWPTSVESMEAAMGQMTPGGPSPIPPMENIQLAVAEQAVVPWWTFAAAIIFGILMAFAIEFLTDYYVSTEKKPVREVAGVSTAGPAPMIIQGFAYAKESSVFMVFAIVIALLFPLFIFNPALYGGYILSFYGIALVGLGLLTTTGYILAMDTFGPISDNAQGVYEMSGEGHDNEVAARAVQRLDAAGNTTKALTKGFAITTAVVAAVALFHSFLEDARLGEIGLRLDLPEIFLGLLIGGAAPFLFSAFAINAVGRSAFELINEVRRQFRSDPGIMAGTSKPDYARCVAIVTAAAQRELLGPGILAIFLPLAVAFGFAIGKAPVEIDGQMYNLTGAQALGGFLAGTILSGQLMAVLLANSGGMWDNAKKLIEDGMYGGKGSPAHKAAVVCDTVGDPFKDTAGPALNPLIKVMNLVALLIVPVVILPLETPVLIAITAVCVVLLAISIIYSKKGSMSESFAAAGAGEAAIEATAPTTEAPKKRLTVDELNKNDEDKS